MAIATETTRVKKVGHKRFDRGNTCPSPLNPLNAGEGPLEEYEAFVARIREEYVAVSELEAVVIDHLAASAWRLRIEARNAVRALREGHPFPSTTKSRQELEQGLSSALQLLADVRASRQNVWGQVARSNRPECRGRTLATAPNPPPLSNEWPVLPGVHQGRLSPAAIDTLEEENEPDPPRWQDRLEIDPRVSERYPVVKGTGITVSHVVSMVVDGWTWNDIVQTHPVLTENDIRTCLAYTVEQDDNGEY